MANATTVFVLAEPVPVLTKTFAGDGLQPALVQFVAMLGALAARAVQRRPT